MRLVDSHAHLNHHHFDRDRDAVMARARAAGVQAILVAGYDLSSSRQAAHLAADYRDVWASAGIHPHDADTCDDNALIEIRSLLGKARVVAVGETGLDYYRNLSPQDAQQRALRAHLALAREVNLPVILHNRDADADLLRILREEGLPDAGGVLHCFSGDEALAAEALSLGLMVSAAGHITYKKNDDLRRAIATVPLDRLLVETDCPYLTPEPYRGRKRRNEPMRVAETARCVAGVLGVGSDDLAQATAENAARLFGLEV